MFRGAFALFHSHRTASQSAHRRRQKREYKDTRLRLEFTIFGWTAGSVGFAVVNVMLIGALTIVLLTRALPE